MVLALGVNTGNAETIGGNNAGDWNNNQATGNYFIVDSGNLPSGYNLGQITSGGGEGITLTWSGASGLVKHDENGSYGESIKANGVVVQYGDGSGGIGTLDITGSNSSPTNIAFTNSTFIGNIQTQQNNGTTHTFNGNGNYNGGEGSTNFAMVGDLIGYGIGANPVFKFTNDANMKGDIIVSGGGANINVAFSGNANTLQGNTIGNASSEGSAKITFDGNASITNSMYAYAETGNTNHILTLNGSTNNLSFNMSAVKNEAYSHYGSSTNTVNITNSASTTTWNGTLSATGTNGTNASNIIEIQNNASFKFTGDISSYGATTSITHSGTGSLSITGNMSATSGNASNIKVALSGSTTGNITGNISTNQGKVYITNTGSGAVSVGDSNKTNTIALAYNGGGSGAGVWITDYDSTTSGFDQSASTDTSGKLTLNLKKVSLSNYSGSYQNGQGQNFIVDYNTGTITIDSGVENDQSIHWVHTHGNTVVMRFRDSASRSSQITIGGVGSDGKSLGNGKLSTSGINGKALFQAHTINAYGNISSNYGSQTYVWGNQIDLHGGSITSSSDGESQKSKSVVIADGSGAVIKAESINVSSEGQAYILLNSNANATMQGQDSAKTTFSLTGAGGKGNAKIFITDYNSTGQGSDAYDGFVADTTQLTTKTNATFDLNTTQIKFANHNGSNVGQTFVLDVNTGTAVIDSGTATQSITASEQGHTLILRYRDTSGDTAITIGADNIEDAEGNKVFN